MTTLTSFIRDIYHFRFNSPFARRVLQNFYNDGQTYTIHFGPLRGIKISYDKSINFHAMLGLWELPSLRFLTKILKNKRFDGEAGIIWDIGANIGMYSAWFSKMRPQYRIHAFEPAPFAKSRLLDTIAINGLTNVTIHEVAFSDKIGEVDFFIGAHHHQSSLDPIWAGDAQIKPQKITVPTLTLDSFYEEHRKEGGPLLIKMDIEGGGVFALKSCEKVMRETSPYIWIESHTPEEDRAISNLLIKYDYDAFRLQTMQWVSLKNEIHPNKEGVWGDLFLCPSSQRAEITKNIG